MYKSAQRPSAVIRAALSEFKRAKHVVDDWVMKVANHKTPLVRSGSSIPDHV